MVVPGTMGPLGLADFVIERSETRVTLVVAWAVLLAVFGSAVVAVTVAVLVMIPPGGGTGLAVTTNSKVALAPAAKLAAEDVTVPVPPAAGAVIAKAGPAVCMAWTKVVFAGTASLRETAWASLGPLLVRITV